MPITTRSQSKAQLGGTRSASAATKPEQSRRPKSADMKAARPGRSHARGRVTVDTEQKETAQVSKRRQAQAQLRSEVQKTSRNKLTMGEGLWLTRYKRQALVRD